MSDASGDHTARHLAVAGLNRTRPTPLDLRPEKAAVERLRMDLGLLALRKVRLSGAVEPAGKGDWRLTAQLGATVEQPCVVTLAPVTTRIDAGVERHYLSGFAPPDQDEAEMADDSAEPVPAVIDLLALLEEELSLALPLYPRAPGVDFDGLQAAAPGVAPMTEDEVRPFAGLSDLRDKLAGKD